jgi:uncharacterized membrane protein
LVIPKAVPIFLVGHVRNFLKRFFYSYILRDFSVGTIQSMVGALLFVFGITFGALTWAQNASRGEDTPVGTVMVATLPIILGFQLLLAALSFDIATPSRPLQRILSVPRGRRVKKGAPLPLPGGQRP